MSKPEYENPEWEIHSWGLLSKKKDEFGYLSLLNSDLTQETFEKIYQDGLFDDVCWCDAFDRAVGAYGERLKGIDELFSKTRPEEDWND